MMKGCATWSLVFLVILVMSCDSWHYSDCDEAKIIYGKEFKPLEYHGILIKKYKNSSRRNHPWLTIKDPKNGYERNYRCGNSNVYNQLKVGDTVFKSSGSLTGYFIQNGDTNAYHHRVCNEDITQEYISEIVLPKDSF